MKTVKLNPNLKENQQRSNITMKPLHRTGNFTWTQTLFLLKLGKKARRKSWNDEKQYIYINKNTDDINTSIILHGSNDKEIPWYVQHEDLLKHDWEIV